MAGIFGLCSISLSKSFLQVTIKSYPSYVLWATRNDNSTDIFRENLLYAILAALCPSNNSDTLKNCPIVVISPAVRLRKPIPSGTYDAQESGKLSWAKLAVPVIVEITITGRANIKFCLLYLVN